MSVAALSHHGHDQLRLKLDLRVREVEAHEHVEHERGHFDISDRYLVVLPRLVSALDG